MKVLILVLALVTLTNCASKPTMTRYNTPLLRVFVDPEGIDSANYVRLVHALKASNKFFVVDREMAFKALMREQSLQHGKASNTRFANVEKYALIGKLFGAGGVIEGRISCSPKAGFFTRYNDCIQNVNIISTVTGEIIHSAEQETEGGLYDSYGRNEPLTAWSDIVEKFNKEFPREFTPTQYTEEFEDYRRYVAEEAIRAQEAGGL